MISYQMSRGTIDGEKKIYQNPSEMQRREIEKSEFALHEVYAVDVLVSSGEGKPRESDIRTTVYKKKDFVYQLRMKSSRVFLSEVEKRFSLMPFTLRHFEDEKRARMGVIECAKTRSCRTLSSLSRERRRVRGRIQVHPLVDAQRTNEDHWTADRSRSLRIGIQDH